MKKINWVRKLTSRKLWLSIASFVSMMIIACGGTENEGAQIAALIMAGATVIGYAIGEGLADSSTTLESSVLESGTNNEDEDKEGK